MTELMGRACTLATMLALLASCVGKPGSKDWRGSIETVDGVTIVSNPKDPLYDPGALRLEEELSIGNEPGRPDHELVQPWYVAANDRGEIFVMDQPNACVKVFSRDGTVIRSVGRRGQGPGELQNPNMIFTTADGRLFIEDFLRGLNVFAPDGTFQEFLPTAGFVDILVTSRGLIVARVNTVEGDSPGKQIRVFDGKMRREEAFPFRPDEARDPNIIKPFAAGFYWALVGDQSLAVSDQEGAYVIDVLALDGRLRRRIKKDHDSVKITAEEIELYEKRLRGRKMHVPPAHPALRGLWADDEGGLIVRTYERASDRRSIVYDVFDAEGRCLVKLPIHETIRPQVWKRGRMYAVQEDAEGDPRVLVFRLVWSATPENRHSP
jgi:hypothetical protein